MKNSEHTRLVAMEMMSPLLKILGETSRKNGMAYSSKDLTKVFRAVRKFPTGHFVSANGGYDGEHEGVFGNDRSLYLHVRPSSQYVTHVDGANQRLHLDDEADRPVHPYIEYLQVKPGAANPGPEHAQQVYEALHRQGYTGDTMKFYAPTDSDGRRDKNGLNRRQRLYRPFVEGWKQFIRAKGYKQYPQEKYENLINLHFERSLFVRPATGDRLAKSLTRRFWERKPQVGAAPSPEPAQDRPSLASRMLGKVKVTRRSGLEGASAIASNPKAAGKIALDMAAPGASAIASGVTALPKVAGGADLSSLVHRIGSNPSAETWVSDGLGIVRGATTGLLGVLVPGGSKSIASSSVTAGPGVMDGIRKLGSDPDFASGASEWWPRKKGAPHPVLQHAIRLAAAGKQITRRGLSDALIREEMTAPIVRSPSGTFHDIPDLIGPKVSNSSGMSVYVLPEEHQTRHLGPIAHYGSDEKFGSVIRLSGHDAEAEDYKKMSEIMHPILAADKADPYVAGITHLTRLMDRQRDKQIAGTAQPWEEAEPISFDGPEHAFEEFDRKHNENGVGKSIVKKGEAEKERRAKKREKEEQEKRAKKPRYRDDDMASRMAAQERMRTAQDRIRPANRSRLERSLSAVQKSAAWQRKEGKNPKSLFKILGSQARDQGMERYPQVAQMLDSLPIDRLVTTPGPSAMSNPAAKEDGHHGVFGKNRGVYIQVAAANDRGELRDGVGPRYPYIDYLQLRPGAKVGSEHVQSFFEALHRQGYDGDTMHFYAMDDGDGRTDANGLNRRDRLFRPLKDQWKKFVAAKQGESAVQKSAAWQRKEGKNPKGGLNAKGRASAKREGHNLRPPVKSGDNPRRASFLARMGGSPGPEYDENGKPTRLLLALRVWGASSKADAKKKAAAMSERLKNKKLAKMSKAEPNHNTSGPRSPRWQPEGGPKLTPRQIAIQQRSAQKLAEIAAIPQGTPAARDASVPKRSRTRLMPKRSQGLLSTATDGHVSVAEAARILGIPHAAVTKHIERGTFPARYDGTKRSIDISHPHFAAVRDGLRQGKTMKTILYDLEEKPVTEEEKKDSYGEMYGYPQGKRRYRSSRTRTGTPKQARLGEYQRVSAATGKPDKRTSLGRAPLADPYALFD